MKIETYHVTSTLTFKMTVLCCIDLKPIVVILVKLYIYGLWSGRKWTLFVIEPSRLHANWLIIT